MWQAGIAFVEARKAIMLGVRPYKLEAWWWAVYRMVWLEVKYRDFVPFPWPGGLGTQVVPGTDGMCIKL